MGVHVACPPSVLLGVTLSSFYFYFFLAWSHLIWCIMGIVPQPQLLPE